MFGFEGNGFSVNQSEFGGGFFSGFGFSFIILNSFSEVGDFSVEGFSFGSVFFNDFLIIFFEFGDTFRDIGEFHL